jgi:hypothetical protein
MEKMQPRGVRSDDRNMKTNTAKCEIAGLECKDCGWLLKVGMINEQENIKENTDYVLKHGGQEGIKETVLLLPLQMRIIK